MLSSIEINPIINVREIKITDSNSATVFYIIAETWKWSQDITEDNCSINTLVPVQRLERNVRTQVNIHTSFPEGVLRSYLSIFWQMPTCLTHEPNGCTVDWLEIQSGNYPLLSVHITTPVPRVLHPVPLPFREYDVPHAQ